MRLIQGPVIYQPDDALFDPQHHHYHHLLAILDKFQPYLRDGQGPVWRLIYIRIISFISKWLLWMQAFIPT